MSCYLDIASPSSYGRFNRKFAHIVGLEAAIYWSELLEVLERVMTKRTFDLDGWFSLDREYIKKRTTFSEQKQHELEDILKELEIIQISPDNKNKVRCDVKTFVRLITEDDVETVNEIKAISRKATKDAKQEGKKVGIINNLISMLNENEEITKAYKIFLEDAYSKGLCSKAKFQVFIDGINNFTKDNDVKLELLKIATETGYTKTDWIINVYNRNKGQSISKSTGEQKVATQLSNIEF